MEHNIYSEVTPEIIRLAKLNEQADMIATELFTKFDVKRGLRDLNGKGVLATVWWMVYRFLYMEICFTGVIT